MNRPQPRRQTRGAVQKSGATFVAAWIPDEIVDALDLAVKRQDTDRSKIIRKAIRAYLAKPV
jgi:metal-responsive CopG/Arc/MetJ family transcriptional regulator